MTAHEMRKLYISYFIGKGHKEIASASLIPENDASVLFTTAGMHPLIPYLLGENHPEGTRLVNVQKCLRTDDIDEVGDDFHHTYFEMLGNWSLGDYFKKESISMSYDFLTSILNIPQSKLAVTVFDGYEEIPRDTESYEFWKDVGLNDNQIFYGGMKENWWGPTGNLTGGTGPCGPDTEIFYDTGKEACSDKCSPLCDCGRFVEIWNNVFIQYNKNIDESFTPLNQKNVDTGMSLERILAVYNNLSNNYETELFAPIIERIEKSAAIERSPENEVSCRIIADHLRAAVFVMGDNKRIAPSNTEQGYIVRRLIRRSVRHIRKINGNENILSDVVNTIININSDIYPELEINRDFILEQIEKESRTFAATIDKGTKRVEVYFNDIPEGGCLSGESAFKLYDTFGFPIEYTVEFAAEKGFTVDVEGFNKKFSEHQEKSRSGAEGKFKGGLADNSEQTERLHTATHLLNGALRKILGDKVSQRGSNITPDRLRFDFSFDRKLTSEEIKQAEDIVNNAIKMNIDVTCDEMTIEEAKNQEAVGVFDNKYGEKVKVYTIGDFSKEICGGPHASNTGELKSFKIIKEESSSSGVRRIKAVIG